MKTLNLSYSLVGLCLNVQGSKGKKTSDRNHYANSEELNDQVSSSNSEVPDNATAGSLQKKNLYTKSPKRKGNNRQPHAASQIEDRG